MDSDISDISESAITGGVGGKIAAPPQSLMSVFEDACPHYMAMGMTYEQFWDGDTSAHKAYRKAKKLMTIEVNTNAWIQGLYVYEALLDVGQYTKAFSKAKPRPYRSEPIELYESQRKEREEREQREKYLKIRQKVADFAKAFNQKRHESVNKEVDDNAQRIP